MIINNKQKNKLNSLHLQINKQRTVYGTRKGMLCTTY